MIPAYHKHCGGVVFLYDHEPVRGEIMRSALAQLPDGSPLTELDKIPPCVKCGASISDWSMLTFQGGG